MRLTESIAALRCCEQGPRQVIRQQYMRTRCPWNVHRPQASTSISRLGIPARPTLIRTFLTFPEQTPSKTTFIYIQLCMCVAPRIHTTCNCITVKQAQLSRLDREATEAQERCAAAASAARASAASPTGAAVTGPAQAAIARGGGGGAGPKGSPGSKGAAGGQGAASAGKGANKAGSGTSPHASSGHASHITSPRAMVQR